MDPDWLKAIGALAVLLLALAGGFLPTRLRGQAGAAHWLSLGNAFAGGIFLGAGLLHLLPHAHEAFNHLAEVHAGEHVHVFPWAMLLAAAGFLLILFIEKVAPPRQDFDEPRMVDEALGHHHHAVGNSTYPAVLLVALSMHAFFAGLALGAIEEGAQILAVLVAILAHKLMESFALGVTLVGSSYTRRRVNQLIVVFSLVTPAGIVAGMLAMHGLHGGHVEWAEAVFNALAAGTFLYIASMDILVEVFHRSAGRWVKFVLVVLGFAAMALIAH